MYISLYRRFRPRTFAEIVGQRGATELLRSSFLEKRLGHAYLFSGPRGCGKTTAARILAKIVNCENPTDDGQPCNVCPSCVAVLSGDHMDVIEIDAASSRGIDQIRELRENVRYASFMGGMKVYIFDEIHMLTTEAFNALLKTLEEPPAGVIFIFATTEPHKVPVTIRSRCQHIPFHRISTEDIVTQIKKISESEGFETENAALWEIARNADGALRDALSLTEQAVSIGDGVLTAAAVAELFGGGSRTELENWLRLLRTDSVRAAVELKEMLNRGVAPERLLDSLFPLLKDMWVYANWGEPAFAALSLSEQEKGFLIEEAPLWTASRLREAAAFCASLIPKARWGLKNDIFAGILLFEMSRIIKDVGPQAGSVPPPTPPGRAKADLTGEVREKKEQPITAIPKSAPAIPPKSPPKSDAARPKAPPEGAEVPASIAEPFSSLWGDDLPLCAAMIDAVIKTVDGELVIDTSKCGQTARALLESPRAKSLIARVFLGEPSTQAEPAGAELPEKKNPLNIVNSGALTMEDIRLQLDANILVYRQTKQDDLSEEDESAQADENMDN